MSVFPHSLSYFNEIAGGPLGGAEHLLHSNLDWGQDLVQLKAWLDDHPQARPLTLVYYGYFNPCYAGIDYISPGWAHAPPDGSTRAPAPGWYALVRIM